MMLLPEYIEWQRPFQEAYLRQRLGKDLAGLSHDEREKMVIETVHALIGEAMEFLDKAVHHRRHRAPGTLNRAAALEELVDMGKFFFNLFLYTGISVEEFDVAFEHKTRVVWQRFQLEFPESRADIPLQYRQGDEEHGQGT